MGLKKIISYFIGFTFFVPSIAFSIDSCKGTENGALQIKLVERKKDLESAIESTIKLIQSLADSEMVAKRNYDISSSISYSLIGAGVTGGIAGAGITALSGGVASFSLRFGTYVAGNTLSTNTVGIAGPLLVGTAVGGLGRAWYLNDGKKNKIDITALSYSYQPVKDRVFDPYERFFSEARTELSNIQKKMSEAKGTNRFFNWNNERDLNKNRLNSVNNFYLLQLLTLEYETIKKSLAYLSAHCDSNLIYLDLDIKAEKQKIFDSYENLSNLKIEDALYIQRQKHQMTTPATQ